MPRRILQGIVVSAKADKTLSVKVERRFMHPIYRKIVKLSKKYATHDPDNKYKEGDIVKIIEHRPISKTKCWKVLDNVE
jgi:small subunit ribosomal protein S17